MPEPTPLPQRLAYLTEILIAFAASPIPSHLLQTLADYAENSLVVELYFDKPLQFNTLARTGAPTQLLIPIEGRHAAGAYVFRGAQGEWWFGAVRMADPSALYAVLQQMGYQAAVFQSPG